MKVLQRGSTLLKLWYQSYRSKYKIHHPLQTIILTERILLVEVGSRGIFNDWSIYLFSMTRITCDCVHISFWWFEDKWGWSEHTDPRGIIRCICVCVASGFGIGPADDGVAGGTLIVRSHFYSCLLGFGWGTVWTVWYWVTAWICLIGLWPMTSRLPDWLLSRSITEY